MNENMTRQPEELQEFADFICNIANAFVGLSVAGVECEDFSFDFIVGQLNALVEDITEEFLTPPTSNNFLLLSQIQRLVCLIENLSDIVDQLECPPEGNTRALAIFAEIICVLVEALAILLGIVFKLIALNIDFLEDNEDFVNCLVCSLANEIDAFEESVRDLRKLLLALVSNIIDTDCTPCHVSTTRPKVHHTCGCKK